MSILYNFFDWKSLDENMLKELLEQYDISEDELMNYHKDLFCSNYIDDLNINNFYYCLYNIVKYRIKDIIDDFIQEKQEEYNDLNIDSIIDDHFDNNIEIHTNYLDSSICCTIDSDLFLELLKEDDKITKEYINLIIEDNINLNKNLKTL